MPSLAHAHDAPQPQPIQTGPLHVVSRSPESRASNEARAWLVVADVTPTGYRVGKFLASHARYATAADVRRNVVPGEIFTYWPQAKIAAEMGCSERQVRRGVRSMREAGALEVRRRVRPCEASYVWVQPVRSDVRSDGAGVRSESACVLSGVRSGVLSGVRSHTEPRKEPQSNHEGSSSRAREVCKICGNNWPAEYGTTCYHCPQPTASQLRRREQQKRDRESEQDPLIPKCTCGNAYHNSYGHLCVDCKGEPSAAQRDAVRPTPGHSVSQKHALPQATATPPPTEPETQPPPETRGQRPENPAPEEHEGPPKKQDKPTPKRDPDALIRFWKEEQAKFNRKYHKGAPREPDTLPVSNAVPRSAG